MSINICRVCGHKLFGEPLLRYENMPKAAQFLPDAKSLIKDKGIDMEICQCAGCGLVQLNGQPVSYYREVVRASAFSEEMKDFRIKQFNDFVRKYSLKGKKIIEIGCGRGEYLSLMRQCGVKTYGLEASAESVKQCRENGLMVTRGFLQNNAKRLKYAPFDAFFILNFLEHLPDPNAVLGGIHANMGDEAIGLIEVPNFDMILQKKLFSEFIADHLFYFTAETLTKTVGRNGFEIIECKEIFHDYIISAVVKKGKRLDIANFYQYQTKLKKEILGYIKRFKDNKVATWGAGHQALAIISMLNLSGKIKYVVDSAVFKQGKYTPATHIPIVSPETLNLDRVDAIIVMAAGYSDEVVRIIQKKYGNMNIAVIRDYGLEVIKN